MRKMLTSTEEKICNIVAENSHIVENHHYCEVNNTVYISISPAASLLNKVLLNTRISSIDIDLLIVNSPIENPIIDIFNNYPIHYN